MSEAARGDGVDTVASLTGTGPNCAFPLTTATDECSDSVFANGTGIVREGDKVAAHPAAGCGPDNSVLTTFSASVKINNKGAGRKGDQYTPDNTITSGSSTIFIGDEADVQSIAGNIFIGAPVPFVTREQAASVLEGAAAGGSSTRNEPFEYGDGGIGGVSPTTGQSGALPSGQSASGEPFEEGAGAGPPAEGGEWLIFLPHTDSRVNTQLAQKATAIAQAMNVQLTITSAYRSPAYNSLAGGVKNSAHTRGNALDVVQGNFTQAQRAQFIQLAVQQGIGGIGIYNGFTHIDVESVRAWGNNGSRCSLPRYPWAYQLLLQSGHVTPELMRSCG